ncbi:hypothetical protein [Burkholderia cepacia]|uniref:hypothetical protein n=1 Tax=Burkholderia cepacia TaxID=292 RepID=UPI0012D9CDFB|nr:hypothetical protein [Burkholderia cepacia]
MRAPSPPLLGKGSAWVGRTEDVKLEVTRQMLFALLNIDFDYFHSRHSAGLFNALPILALDDTAF